MSRRDIDGALAGFIADIGPSGPVAVEGNRTRWDLGGEPAPEARLVKAPTGIVDYQPHEMTVRVRAGTSVAELDAALLEAGQRSALPDRGGTVGGALAVGQNTVDVLGRGRVRDAVLEVRYVSADGHAVTAGGPTVKNVSGFNLPKVLVGSLGTLGLIAEATLRTNPLPEADVWLRASGVDPILAFDAVLRPAAVLYDGSAVWVHLEGHAVDVEVETRTLSSIGAFEPVDGPPHLPAHRWSLRPDEVVALGPSSPVRSPLPTGRFVGLVGNGLVFAQEPQPPRPVEAAIATVGDRMKQLFDPTGRLNPGRRP